jgi:quinol monooxygenase YgiN
MSEPIVFISHLRIKEDKLDGFKHSFRQGAELIEASKPGTVVFLGYVNEDGTELTVVHVFPDGDAMELHWQGAAERTKASSELLETVSFEIYGKPSDKILEMMKEEIERSGAVLRVQPQPLGGYIRFRSG